MQQIPGREGRVTVDDNFVGLWRWSDKKDPVFAKLRESYDAALKVASEFAAKRGALARDKRLTADGQVDELMRWTKANALGAIAKGRKVAVQAARKEIDQRREKLQLEGPDKTDLAGVMMRQEIRTWLRGLSIDERSKLLGTDVDPLIALAVVEAPAPLSGVNEFTHDRLVNRAIDALHPGERDEIAELEQAVETVERAIGAARSGIVAGLRLSNREFERMLEGAPLEGMEPVYLKRQESGAVLAIFKGPSGMAERRPATNEDLAHGRWIIEDDPSTQLPSEWLGMHSGKAA
ncbi:hypothetical protein [Hyphomicrobium sp.]|uniref:hypothetical protein n=1 Tax=Hyphomicrobium sp. TaxID=82 RepID=UPI0025C31B64|nr:hypothetical protein [Hyphomicrobium sp.]MCC7253185.1 hypothetical protein [Hyphomicrobium sp.]